jgi:hypothetical protein
VTIVRPYYRPQAAWQFIIKAASERFDIKAELLRDLDTSADKYWITGLYLDDLLLQPSDMLLRVGHRFIQLSPRQLFQTAMLEIVPHRMD